MTSSRLITLLGLLAVAGYQNRDKLAGMLGTARAGQSGTGSNDNASGGGLGGLLGGLGGLIAGTLSGRDLATGLGELVDNFRQKGHAQQADSWVATGANSQLTSTDLEEVLGPSAIDALARETGLDRAELLKRLSTVLPQAVDQMTPAGRLPSQDDLAKLG